MSTETSIKYYFKGNFWSGGVIIDEFSVLQDENGDWWRYKGYRNKPFNVFGGERPDTKSWVNVGSLIASGITDQDVTFDKGGKIESKNQFVLDEISGMWYYWNGELPKIVPVNSHVENTGGVGSGAWMPIEGLISQNLTNIRFLQQVVNDQSDTLALLQDMQVQQTDKITQLKTQQDEQIGGQSGQSKDISDLSKRVTTLETDTGGQPDWNEDVLSQVKSLQTSGNETKVAMQSLQGDVTAMSQVVEAQNLSISGQNDALANQQRAITEIKNSTKQQQDSVSSQQQSITSLQTSQVVQDSRIDANDAHDKEQDTLIDAQGKAIVVVQEKVTALEKSSSDQAVVTADLGRRIGVQESASAETANAIKGQNDRISLVQQSLSDMGVINKTQSDDIDALKKANTEQDTLFISQGKAIQSNTTDIADLKKRESDQDTLLATQSTTISSIQLTLQASGADVSALKTGLSDLLKVSSDQGKAITSNSDSISNLSQSLATLNQTVSSHSTKLDNQSQAMSAIQSTQSSQSSSLSTLQTNLGSAQTQMTSVVSNIGSIQTSVSGLQTSLSGKFNSPAGTTAQYIRGDGTLATFPTLPSGTVTKVTAGAGLSGGDITSSGTISMPNVGAVGNYTTVTTDAQGRVTGGNKRSFVYPTRSLNTAFKISDTQDAHVSYTIDITVAALLIAGTSGRVYLEYADNAAMSTNLVVVNESCNSIGGVLNVNSIGPGNVRGWIPAGKYARIRTSNVVGTPTFTFVRAEEILE